MLTRRNLISSAILAIATRPAFAKPTTHHVDILNFEFTPKFLAVDVGDKVVFTNKDVVPHTVSSVNADWGSGNLVKDAEWTFNVTQRGDLNYFCKHHPVMQGTLISS